jgi:hypothetical protein
MHFLKQHSAFKVAILIIVAILLTPTAVKFNHVFSHHQHEVCKGEFTTHIHAFDSDCDFYKFKLTNPFTFFNYDVAFKIVLQKHQNNITHYSFLTSYQALHFTQRGPPINDLT